MRYEWWNDPVQVVRLALWMLDNHYTRDEVRRMGEKPWHYNAEWERSRES